MGIACPFDHGPLVVVPFAFRKTRSILLTSFCTSLERPEHNSSTVFSHYISTPSSVMFLQDILVGMGSQGNGMLPNRCLWQFCRDEPLMTYTPFIKRFQLKTNISSQGLCTGYCHCLDFPSLPLGCKAPLKSFKMYFWLCEVFVAAHKFLWLQQVAAAL